jgi:hypothetical protein
MSIKPWLRASAIAILSVALTTTMAAAEEHGHGHDKHDRDDDDRYSDHDREQARDWYRGHYSNLPPGLAKRDRLPPGLEKQLVVRGTLPPGLQKKMQPCPRDLEMRLPPPPPNYAHVVIGGNLVLLNRANFQIADVFHLEIK